MTYYSSLRSGPCLYGMAGRAARRAGKATPCAMMWGPATNPLPLGRDGVPTVGLHSAACVHS